MSIAPGRLLDIERVGDPVSVAQDNFEILTEEVFKVVPTYQSGSPTIIIGPPTSGDHALDERWKDAWNGEWRCTVAGTPGTWRQERPAIRAGEPASGTIPVGYQIEDSTDNYRRKWHVGAYVWESVSAAYQFQRVTGFTGGGATNLDGVSTTSLADGTIAEFTVGSTRYLFRLRAGTDNEVSPYIVRPDDYNASTNAKVWERLWRSDYPGNVSLNITSLTGGTISDLNGIPTVTMTIGTIIWFIFGSALVCYRLRTGLDSTSSPLVIRPVDYQSSLNPKIWERVANVSAPGDVMIGNNDLSEVSATSDKRANARNNIEAAWTDDVTGFISALPQRGLILNSASDGITGNDISAVSVGTGAFAIAFSFSFADFDAVGTTVVLFSSHALADGKQFEIIFTGSFFLRIYPNPDHSGQVLKLLDPVIPLVSGKVYHFLFTTDRTTGVVYFNGESDRDEDGQVSSVDNSSTSSVNIGNGASGGFTINGSDDSRITFYNLMALSANVSSTQARSIAEKGFIPRELSASIILDLDFTNLDPSNTANVKNKAFDGTKEGTIAGSPTQIFPIKRMDVRRLSVGASTELKKLLSATATLDFGSISPNAQADLTISVPGALVGDSVALGLPSASAAGIVFNAFVSATDTVKVRAGNITASGVDPASATYRVTVFQFA